MLLYKFAKAELFWLIQDLEYKGTKPHPPWPLCFYSRGLKGTQFKNKSSLCLLKKKTKKKNRLAPMEPDHWAGVRH